LLGCYRIAWRGPIARLLLYMSAGFAVGSETRGASVLR